MSAVIVRMVYIVLPSLMVGIACPILSVDAVWHEEVCEIPLWLSNRCAIRKRWKGTPLHVGHGVVLSSETVGAVHFVAGRFVDRRNMAFL